MGCVESGVGSSLGDIFTPPALTAEPTVPLSNCGQDPR